MFVHALAVSEGFLLHVDLYTLADTISA